MKEKKEIDYDDIKLKTEVYLGSSELSLKQVKEFGKGSIIELDTLAGEDIIMTVNGIPKWRGEILVIDGKYGIRARNPI